MEIANQFINANREIMNRDKIKSLNKAYIIVQVLLLCLLPFAGGNVSIVGIVVSTIYSITAYVFNRISFKKGLPFQNVFISFFMFWVYLIITFNLMIYSFPRLVKLNLDIVIILIIVFELVTIAFGCFYTYLSLKKKKVKELKKQSTLAYTITATLCGCWTIFLRRYVSKQPIETQAFIFISVMSICCSYLAFYFGKILIPMFYLIKKYNITKFSFTDETYKENLQ